MEDVDIGNPAYKRDFGERECENCLGKGYNNYSDREECDYCDGLGVVQITQEEWLDWIESKKEDLREKE